MQAKALFASLVLGLLGSQVSSAGILAGPVTNAANGSIYYLLTSNTWAGSEAEAVSLGGHLATINSAEENQWVFTNFTALAGTPKPSFWIGLTDEAVEGQFVWVSGQPVTYTFWYPGEPSNTSNEDYTAIRHGNAAPPLGSWNDLYERVSDGPGVRILGVVEIEPFRLTIQVDTVAIEWDSVSNTVYQLQYRSPLSGNVWLNLGSATTGTGSRVVVYDSVLGDPRRQYRVEVVP